LIVALGKVAAQNLLGLDATLASLRGRMHRYPRHPADRDVSSGLPFAYSRRQSKSWEDLCFALDTMKALKREQSDPT